MHYKLNKYELMLNFSKIFTGVCKITPEMDATFLKIWYEIKFQMRKRTQSVGILSKVNSLSCINSMAKEDTFYI